jgi:hypothetical protein
MIKSNAGSTMGQMLRGRRVATCCAHVDWASIDTEEQLFQQLHLRSSWDIC